MAAIAWKVCNQFPPRGDGGVKRLERRFGLSLIGEQVCQIALGVPQVLLIGGHLGHFRREFGQDFLRRAEGQFRFLVEFSPLEHVPKSLWAFPLSNRTFGSAPVFVPISSVNWKI